MELGMAMGMGLGMELSRRETKPPIRSQMRFD